MYPSAMTGAPKQASRTGASNIVGYVARSASVFLRALTETRISALATGTNSIRRSSPSALEEEPTTSCMKLAWDMDMRNDLAAN